MLTLRKTCACVVREGQAGIELLCFEHPDAGVQIPKGGLEPGEDPTAGVLRELHEETGVRAVEVVAHLGVHERHTGGGPDERGEPERHLWDVFLLRPSAELPDEWLHDAWGSPEEDGLTFRCHWLAVDSDLAGALHPLFTPIVQMLRRHLDPAIEPPN